jgi:hypothetical protein
VGAERCIFFGLGGRDLCKIPHDKKTTKEFLMYFCTNSMYVCVIDCVEAGPRVSRTKLHWVFVVNRNTTLCACVKPLHRHRFAAFGCLIETIEPVHS